MKNTRTAKKYDAGVIAGIYNHFIRNSVATFELEPVAPKDIIERISQTEAASLPWIVSTNADNVVTGYAFASPWKARPAYKNTVEISAYVSPDHARQGIGTALYTELFERLRKESVHTVLAGISLPNDASVALHEKFGLTKVAHLKEVGYKFNNWVDVAYWQGMLERMK